METSCSISYAIPSTPCRSVASGREAHSIAKPYVGTRKPEHLLARGHNTGETGVRNYKHSRLNRNIPRLLMPSKVKPNATGGRREHIKRVRKQIHRRSAQPGAATRRETKQRQEVAAANSTRRQRSARQQECSEPTGGKPRCLSQYFSGTNF